MSTVENSMASVDVITKMDITGKILLLYPNRNRKEATMNVKLLGHEYD